MRDGLNVVWVDATPDPAFMVDLHSLGNIPEMDTVAENVSIDLSA